MLIEFTLNERKTNAKITGSLRKLFFNALSDAAYTLFANLDNVVSLINGIKQCNGFSRRYVFYSDDL